MQHCIEALSLEHEVGDEHDALAAALRVVSPRDEAVVRLDVQPRVRLIEQHDRRIMKQRDREVELLARTAAELLHHLATMELELESLGERVGARKRDIGW